MTVDQELAEKRRFTWGQNWAEFAETVVEQQLREAEQGILDLLSADIVQGARFLDIGTGSGIHSAAALRLGVGELTAIDYDPTCVATAERLITQQGKADNWKVIQDNILDPQHLTPGSFDVVYSWGVLHHTGDMWTAIDNASKMVREGGTFCIAIYAKTALCGFWKVEKRLHLKLPRPMKRASVYAFIVWTRLVEGVVKLANGRNPFFREAPARGQREVCDAIDWLGGYPYESATPDEIKQFVEQRGFELSMIHPSPGGRHGLLGSGCDEYVFRRKNAEKAER